ncbi:hypothetical protein ARMSODRAFT_1054538 [Armillaria solidipes]|uniref:Uncharacterized protein n=1 Tax=Armillaria solidipes TaxID=1076256 RepID=A0A2H3B3P5_9AGAR|nr:hypothetical protein ARMSODRAFT_1054538 [Armillaria solidipes]
MKQSVRPFTLHGGSPAAGVRLGTILIVCSPVGSIASIDNFGSDPRQVSLPSFGEGRGTNDIHPSVSQLRALCRDGDDSEVDADPSSNTGALTNMGNAALHPPAHSRISTSYGRNKAQPTSILRTFRGLPAMIRSLEKLFSVASPCAPRLNSDLKLPESSSW